MKTEWHVLHVRPRCEKKMVEHCTILRIKHYLPLRSETKVYQRRKVTVEKPVFPGYFFACFDDDGRLGLLKTNTIVRILNVPSQRELLHELAQVRKALAVDPSLGTCEALKKGCLIRIRSGPFQGVEGLVESLKANMKVCLNVEMIGQAIAVEVDRGMVEIIT